MGRLSNIKISRKARYRIGAVVLAISVAWLLFFGIGIPIVINEKHVDGYYDLTTNEVFKGAVLFAWSCIGVIVGTFAVIAAIAGTFVGVGHLWDKSND